MGEFLTIISVIVLWIISFVEPSGWAMAIHLPEKINGIILFVAICIFLSNNKKGYKFHYSGLLYLLIGVSFIIIPYVSADSFQGLTYLTSFLVVYILSFSQVTKRVIRITSITIGILGLVVLGIYLFRDDLKGWNDNAISMIGLFSFIYFTIYLNTVKGRYPFIIWNIVSLIYFRFLFSTDCRSGMVFTILAILSIVYSAKIIKILSKPNTNFLLLNFPIILAIIVFLISQSSYFQSLNEWSEMKFGKMIFSERDLLWDKAFQLLERSNFIGTGKFILNYHNSGIAALSVFGVFGYIVWVKYFATRLRPLSPYFSDKIVYGSTVAFFLIFLQQSVELGFISEYPNYLPYTILGLALARVRMNKNAGR